MKKLNIKNISNLLLITVLTSIFIFSSPAFADSVSVSVGSQPTPLTYGTASTLQYTITAINSGATRATLSVISSLPALLVFLLSFQVVFLQMVPLSHYL